MIHARHWFRSALPALLALALLSGGSLAAGDLFDDDYADCPHRTRMRDGEIADLTVARDAEEADEVNVAWAATDPATWGLGPNAYSTRLVVILDDNDGDDPVTKTLSLGTRKTTFEGVAKGREVTVQLAIVVDTAEGDYLISDILEQRVNQSLTAPSFSADWIIKGRHDCFGTNFARLVDIPYPELGSLYYIGYNENFANYRAGTAVYNHRPETPRLRIGLAHGGEDDGARDDVKFDTYLLRLVDEDGDVVPEGDDVATMATDYGQEFYAPFSPSPTCSSGRYDRVLVLDLDYTNTGITSHLNTLASDRAALVARGPVSNVRINDGGTIAKPMYQTVGRLYWNLGGARSDGVHPYTRIVAHAAEIPGGGDVYVLPPDRHRDFPVDTLTSDRTYTIEAWAVNEEREVISPRTTLKIHPVEYVYTLVPDSNPFGTDFTNQYTPGRLQDYLNVPLVFPDVVPAPQNGTLLITDFTVFK